jgi:hypothetical protein
MAEQGEVLFQYKVASISFKQALSFSPNATNLVFPSGYAENHGAYTRIFPLDSIPD